jgi:hypothetical protein
MSKRFLAIVDPWANILPHDADNYPHLQSDSEIQYQLIHNQLSRLKVLFDDIIVISSGYPIHPLFAELVTVSNVITSGYLEDKQDWNMWVCGFHDGRCIQGKIEMVVEHYKWNYSRFHVVQNLSFTYPKDAKRIFYKQDWIEPIAKNVKVYDWDYVDEFHLCGTNAIYVWDMDR